MQILNVSSRKIVPVFIIPCSLYSCRTCTFQTGKLQCHRARHMRPFYQKNTPSPVVHLTADFALILCVRNQSYAGIPCGWKSTCWCKGNGFSPWSRKIPPAVGLPSCFPLFLGNSPTLWPCCGLPPPKHVWCRSNRLLNYEWDDFSGLALETSGWADRVSTLVSTLVRSTLRSWTQLRSLFKRFTKYSPV